tara:strand:+ start:13421 stop:14863 length:1443 start_codon:yes stop_codon:yes gene_type:complete
MTEFQINVLKTNGWNPNTVVPIPDSIVKKAQTKTKWQSTVVEIDVPAIKEAFPDCTHIAHMPWLKVNGLWVDYEKFAVSEPEQDMKFDDRLNKAKEIAGSGVEDKAPTTAPKVPTVPSVSKAEEAKPKEEEKKEPARFKRYVERLDYLKEKGLVHDTLVKGYVNEAKDRFVDANVVKNFDAPEDVIDQEFIKFIDQRLKIEFEHPDNKKIEDFMDSPTEVPDVTEGLNNLEKVIQKCDDKMSEVPKSLTLAEEEKIIKERVQFLEARGFVQNKQTYVFQHENFNDVSYMRAVKDVSPKGQIVWDALAEDIAKSIEVDKAKFPEAETSMDMIKPSTEKEEDGEIGVGKNEVGPDSAEMEWAKKTEETKEVDSVSTEDLEAAAEKFDNLVAEQDNAEPPFVENEDEEDDLIGAVADYRKNHPEKDSLDRHFEKELEFTNRLANLFTNHSEAIVALSSIKNSLNSNGSDKEKLEVIQEVINNL